MGILNVNILHRPSSRTISYSLSKMNDVALVVAGATLKVADMSTHLECGFVIDLCWCLSQPIADPSSRSP